MKMLQMARSVMFEWVTQLELFKETGKHAQNVRFVHTCLHVCVGTGNLVMCMTEDCAINCGLELQTKGTRPFTGITWLWLGSGSGLALRLGRELQTKDKAQNKCCCSRKKIYAKHSPSGQTIPGSVRVRVRARAANEGQSPNKFYKTGILDSKGLL